MYANRQCRCPIRLRQPGAELIEKGLGYTYDGLDRGIDSHIKNLRKKIEPDPVSPTYIQTVYGVGYRLGA
jgi:DNA-binding response OmpR family regulator